MKADYPPIMFIGVDWSDIFDEFKQRTAMVGIPPTEALATLKTTLYQIQVGSESVSDVDHLIRHTIGVTPDDLDELNMMIAMIKGIHDKILDRVEYVCRSVVGNNFIYVELEMNAIDPSVIRFEVINYY